LGVHIDGFLGLVGHTVVVSEGEVSGRKADVILAAYNAINGALRLLKPGSTNN
jgi:methionine aminopeptidase